MGYSPWGHKESDMTERLSILSFQALRVPIGIAFLVLHEALHWS